jgi:hypothetical protein
MSSPKELIKRMLNIINGRSYTDLAHFLGVSRNTVDVWIRRGKIPEKNLFKFCQLTGANLDWLLTGEGEMYPQNKSLVIKGNHINGMNNSNIAVGERISISSTHPKNVSDDEDKLLETFRSLPEDLRRVYLLRMEADAIEHRLRRNINE